RQPRLRERSSYLLLLNRVIGRSVVFEEGTRRAAAEGVRDGGPHPTRVGIVQSVEGVLDRQSAELGVTHHPLVDSVALVGRQIVDNTGEEPLAVLDLPLVWFGQRPPDTLA